jgi:outer membrane protein assembly factor BamB
VQCFDLRTGERLWSVYSEGEGVVPSPVAGTGLVFTSSGFGHGTIRAIRTGGRGDVTGTHIAWEQTKGVPLVSSFLYVRPYLYSITMNGIGFCFEAETGNVVWQERIGGNQWASPIYANGHIYFLSEEGETAVIEAKPQFHLIARNPLHERTQASLAVCGRYIFIRTERNLYSIGKSANASE